MTLERTFRREHESERLAGFKTQAIHRSGVVSHSGAAADQQVVDKRVAEGSIAPDDRGCLDQSNIGGEVVTVRRQPAGAPPAYPQQQAESAEGRGNLIHDTSEEARAFEHEHARLYAAIKVAEERAELTGHVKHAADLRRMRASVAEHVAYHWCEP